MDAHDPGDEDRREVDLVCPFCQAAITWRNSWRMAIMCGAEPRHTIEQAMDPGWTPARAEILAMCKSPACRDAAELFARAHREDPDYKADRIMRAQGWSP